MNRNGKPAFADFARDVAAGALAGLAGSWAMNQFQAGMANVGKHGAPNQQHREEPATAKAAGKISEAVAGRSLTKKERTEAEPWVHYGFGTLTGALYGGLKTAYSETEAGAGTVFGSVVWLVGDEIGVPVAGLSKPPDQIPVSIHLLALGSHLVYGLTLFGVTRLIRRVV